MSDFNLTMLAKSTNSFGEIVVMQNHQTLWSVEITTVEGMDKYGSNYPNLEQQDNNENPYQLRTMDEGFDVELLLKIQNGEIQKGENARYWI